MELFIKANRVSRYNMRMIIENARILTIMLIVFLFIVQNLSSVLLFSKSVNISVTPYAFTFLVNDYICQFIIIAGAVVIFSNAPFENEGHLYMFPRAGRISWGLGQIIYIFKMSLLYTIFLMATTVIPFVGHLKFDTEWGKIWGTLAKTGAGGEFGLNFSVSNFIISKYTPINALLLSLLLEWACIMWIGLLIYFGNKITNKSFGTIAGMFFTLLDVCVANDWTDFAYGISPVSLAQIETYSGYAKKYGVNLTYGIKFFALGIIILLLLCLLSNYKSKIERCIYQIRKITGGKNGTKSNNNDTECNKGI